MSREALLGIRAGLVAAVEDLDRLLAELAPPAASPGPSPSGADSAWADSAAATPLAWSAKVSTVFCDRVRWICENLDIGSKPGRPAPDWLMTWIAWETGRSFRADIRNMAGSGATGLIQFMPDTALHFFHTKAAIAKMTKAQRQAAGRAACDRLAALTPEDQLNYVYRYFKPYAGRIRSLADGYMAILWPAAIGQPLSAPLWDRTSRPTTYRQNAGLDVDKDGVITKGEAAAKVTALLAEGLQPANVARGNVA
ncbi:hypothetical protein [Phenylobacterium sp.]|uniref:hypothetical protein n=1 Tax=Phenylobacterium sp. TaxID=1871053 RepID=UPI00301CAB62